MAKKRLGYDQIAEKDLFNPLIKELKEVNSILAETKKALTDIAKESIKLAKQTPLEGYKDVQKVEKSLSDTEKALKDIDKVEKERIKLQEQINSLDDERIKNNIQLREELNAQKRELRAQAKDVLNTANAYKKLTSDTNKAQAEFKRLAAQYGASSKEAADARKQFDKLDKQLREVNDAARDGRRDVGRYKLAVEGLDKAAKRTGALALLVATLSALSNAFSQNTEGSAKLEKIFSRLTIAVTIFVNRAVKGLVKAQLTLEKFIKQGELLVEQAKFWDKDAEAIERLTTEIALLNKQIADQPDTFAGITEEIEKTLEANDKLIDNTIKYRKEIIVLQKDLAGLREQQELLSIVSDDNTLSLETQIQAAIDLNDVNQKAIAIEVAIAKKRFDLANEAARVNKANLDLQEAAAEAFVTLEETKIQAAIKTQEEEKRLREIQRDNDELDLDQLIDIADRRKTINEQIAADDRNTLEERSSALDRATQDIEASFRAQAEVLKRTGIEFNIDDLINEEDTVKLNARIKALGFDEIRQNRLREVIQERAQAIQDLRVAQQDLNDTTQEARDIQSELLIQEETLAQLNNAGVDTAKVLEAFQKRRLQNEIDNLELRKAIAKEGSVERLEIEKELNEKLIEQQENRIAEEKENEKKRLEALQALQEKAFGAIRAFQEKRASEREEQINKELSAEEERIQRLRELAAEGNEDAENNLALAQKRQAELLAQKEKDARKAQRAELLLSTIETYSAKVSAGDKNPLASTIADTQLLISFINSLPAFYKGSEKVSDDLDPIVSGKDGHIIRVDGDERILSPSQNSMIPKGMSNLELAMLASRRADLSDSSSEDRSYEILSKGLEAVKQSIDNQPHYMGMDYDARKMAMTDFIFKKNKLERKHRKNGGIWG